MCTRAHTRACAHTRVRHARAHAHTHTHATYTCAHARQHARAHMGISVICARKGCHLCPTTFVHITRTFPYMHHDYIHFTFIPREPPSRTFTHMLFESIQLHARDFSYMRYIQLHYIQIHAYTCTFECIRRTFHPITHSPHATCTHHPPSYTFTLGRAHSSTFSSPSTLQRIPHLPYSTTFANSPPFSTFAHLQSHSVTVHSITFASSHISVTVHSITFAAVHACIGMHENVSEFVRMYSMTCVSGSDLVQVLLLGLLLLLLL